MVQVIEDSTVLYFVEHHRLYQMITIFKDLLLIPHFNINLYTYFGISSYNIRKL